MSKIKLPNKPSELIRLAVKDLVLVENDKRYSVNMHEWHTPWFVDNDYDIDYESEESVIICSVCFAGSVMAKTLDYALWGTASISNDEHSDHFYFLDQIRQYQITDEYVEGMMRILHKSDEEVNKINLGLEKVSEFIAHRLDYKVEYDDNEEQFKKNMLLIADKFEEEGL